MVKSFKIKHFRLLVAFILLWLPAAIQADGVQYLTFTLKGKTVSFALSELPVITYTNDQLVVSTPKEVVSIPVNEIYEGRFTDNATGLYKIESAPANVSGGHVRFSDLQPKAIVSVYTIDGKRVMQQAAQRDGSADVDLHALGKGTYIIKSPTQTIKVMNK